MTEGLADLTGAVETELAGEPVALLPQRGLFWPGESTLFVADLHLGKCETFRKAGAPIPAGVLEETLARLDAAIEACAARRLVVLGDLTHAPIGVTETMISTVSAWRDATDVEMVLVHGNHDRHLKRTGMVELAQTWSMDLLNPGAVLGPFTLLHEPERFDASHALAGHLHPSVYLRGGGDAVKTQVFWTSGGPGAGGTTVLPAFSFFAAGTSITNAKGDGVWAVTPQCVIELSPPA
ncbi:MAG: ligase-associated DNA damage response endonuclease PdeM [Planctomycetota bacterium]